MEAAEIIPACVHRDSSFKIFQTLAESQSEASKAPQMRFHAEVGSLNMARADVGCIEITANWGWDRFDNLGRAVATGASVVRGAINLNELGKVYICSKAFFYCSDNVPYGTINPLECYATANFRVRDFGRARNCNSTGRAVYAK